MLNHIKPPPDGRHTPATMQADGDRVKQEHMTGGESSPICVEDDERIETEDDEAPQGGDGRTQYVFYGVLFSTASVNNATMEQFPYLNEFVQHRKPSDGAIVFRAVFQQGHNLTREWFQTEMRKRGLELNPTSVPLPSGQVAWQHSYTQGRIHNGKDVEFHWRAPHFVPRAYNKRPKRRLQPPTQPVPPSKTTPFVPYTRPAVVVAAPDPVIPKRIKPTGSVEERDFQSMSFADMATVITLQDEERAHKDELIRLMRKTINTLSETESQEIVTLRARIAEMERNNGSIDREIAELRAQNSTLLGDNATIIEKYRTLEKKLRQAELVRDDLIRQKTVLKGRMFAAEVEAETARLAKAGPPP